MKRLSTEQFIEQATEVHGDTYDYSLVDYKNSDTNIKIICKKHGVFEQTPYTHKKGSGCKKCHYENNNKSRQLTTEQFIKKARQVHGNKYDYSKTKYKNSKTKVKIICPEHGEFTKNPGKHFEGQGCKICSDKEKSEIFSLSYSNWEKMAIKSKNFDSYKAYKIRCWNDQEGFYKVGRTFLTLEERFSQNDLPYNYEILSVEVFDNALKCCRREEQLKREHKSFKYVPKLKFNGMYECFTKLKSN